MTNVGDGIRRKYQADDRWNLGTVHDAHHA